MSTSEKDKSQAKVLAMTKERDEFAKLALERGKALEVSQLLQSYQMSVIQDMEPGHDPFIVTLTFDFEIITKSQTNTELFC